MYKADVKIPRDMGSCERGKRGSILYKDSSEFLCNKNFAQGFFYVEVQNIANVNCVSVILDVNSRTNVGVWLEHHCVKDLTGERRGVQKKRNLYKDIKPLECFAYFKSTAYLEFRFYFSFKAILEVSLYGTPEDPRIIPNPNKNSEETDAWWPTDRIIRWGYFVPYYVWWYDM
ncbi:uncharacterized protein [Epargyreus clarus]|uniref:uncharacterized protein n=1 Tax=Epargyreus clarus TaxID=520877 RepID=UPI003C2BD8A6